MEWSVAATELDTVVDDREFVGVDVFLNGRLLPMGFGRGRIPENELLVLSEAFCRVPVMLDVLIGCATATLR